VSNPATTLEAAGNQTQTGHDLAQVSAGDDAEYDAAFEVWCFLQLWQRFFLVFFILFFFSDALNLQAPNCAMSLMFFFFFCLLLFAHETLQRSLRHNRIVMNNVESIPMGLLVAWSSCFCCGNKHAHIALVIAFAAGRTVFPFAYAYALQPHRSIVWMVAYFAVWGLVVRCLIFLIV
jgi:uncharacterized MAPEG superfamily protein